MRYRFDNSLSRGIWGVLAWLGLLAVAFFLLIAVVVVVTGIGPGGEPTTFPEAVWFALTRSLDPGTFSGDEGLGFRLVMLIVTLTGIFLAAAIIGLVSSAIDRRLDNLRRGRSLVVEEGHTLILGMSSKLVPIISEIVEANASERDRAIVVLTPEDTVETSDFIRASIPDLKTSRLVVRSGTPTRLTDLEQGNPASARAIIIVRPESDAQVVKTALGVIRSIGAASAASIVAELEDPDTAVALGAATQGRVLTVNSREIIALIGAQVARAPGLGAIYQELMDFDGDEFYAVPVTPAWVGHCVGEALLASSRATILGVRRADGTTIVGPDLTLVLAEGDHLIGIAEDDSVFTLDCAPQEWRPAEGRVWQPLAKERERTLIIGWSSLAPGIAEELDLHVAADSEIHLLAHQSEGMADAIRASMRLHHQNLTIHIGDPIDRRAVHAAMDAGPFNHVLLLSEEGDYSADEADARTMLSLLHVHGHALDGRGPDNVVAELLDPNDVELTGAADNRDFIVSQRLIALLIAQLSESPHLYPVFEEIFDADGANIVLHPASRYVPPGSTTFRDILKAAREWGTVPLGYRAASLAGRAGTLGNGIRINPPKDEAVTLGQDDAIILIDRPRD